MLENSWKSILIGFCSILISFFLNHSVWAAKGGLKGSPTNDEGGGGGQNSKDLLAIDDQFTVHTDEISITGNVLNNDNGPKQKKVTTVQGQIADGQPILLPSGAQISIDEIGNFSYFPNGAYNNLLEGETALETLTYSISHRKESDQGFITIIIHGKKLDTSNQPPNAQDDSIETEEDSIVSISVLNNDSDPDGDALNIITVSAPKNGSAVIQDKVVSYTPNANFYGIEVFNYSISDGNLSTTAQIQVTVRPVNDHPYANDDSYSTTVDVTLNASSVLNNDSDVDGNQLSVYTFDQNTAQNGVVAMSSDGSFTYNPPLGFSGTDSFNYTATDGNSGFSQATVNIQVKPTADDGVPYYIEGIIYSYESWRLNYPENYGTGAIVTYSVLKAAPPYYSKDHTVVTTFSPMTEQHTQAIRDLLKKIEAVTNLTFVETSDELAEMTFGLADLSRFAMASPPREDGVGNSASDVWLQKEYSGTDFVHGTRPYQTLLHEIGHALGLDHARSPIPNEENNNKFSLMGGAPHPSSSFNPENFQLYDLASLHYLYGKPVDEQDNTYVFEDCYNKTKLIWDAGGDDLIDMSSATVSVDVNLNPGEFSTIYFDPQYGENVAIAYGSVIENFVGGPHDDRVVSNKANNNLTGGEGSDTFVFDFEGGQDTIHDFNSGIDKVDMRSMGLNYLNISKQSTSSGIVIEYPGGSVLLKEVFLLNESDFL